MNTNDSRELTRDRRYVDQLARKMLEDARRYDLSVNAHASALRGFEQRYGCER